MAEGKKKERRFAFCPSVLAWPQGMEKYFAKRKTVRNPLE